MCGIYGMVLQEAIEIPFEVGLAAAEVLLPRGPDALGTFREPGVLLGMRRLAIIDPSGPCPPFGTEDGRIQAVANGEIYNHRELRRYLRQQTPPHQFKTNNDLEVLPHLLEVDPSGWMLRLRGMFALAIWDRHARQLQLVRDWFGIKPLFWAGSPQAVAFASTLPALKSMLTAAEQSGLPIGSCCRPSNWKLSPESLSSYLNHLYVPSPEAIYDPVSNLPPASQLLFSPGHAPEIKRYWNPTYQPIRKISLTQAVDDFLAVFRESIRYHLIADVPIGAFLSGGLDSALVVAEASRQTAHLNTYTVVFPDRGYNEIEEARAVASRFCTNHHEIQLQGFEPTQIESLVGSFNQPFGDSSAWPTWLISREVSKWGRVALSGEGGDELMGGYPYYPLANLSRFLPKRTANSPSLPNQLGAGLEKGTLSGLKRRFADLFRPADELYQRWRTLDPFNQIWQPLAINEWWQHPTNSGSGAPHGNQDWPDVHSALLARDVQGYLPGDLLEKVDTMSMCHSLEVRVPFLDVQLFETINHYPSALKLSGFQTKWLVRQAFRKQYGPNLPDCLLTKRKHGFAIPVHNWIGTRLADLCRDSFLGRDSRLSEYFDLRLLRRFYESHRAGRIRAGHHLWALLILDLWLRKNA